MAKNRNRRQIKIAGKNGATHIKVPTSRIDPNVAPQGAAFTVDDANRLAQAALSGCQQIFKAMGLRGFFVTMVVPVVEYVKDIPLPTGGSKDDFVIRNGVYPAYSSVGGTPEVVEAAKVIAATLWKGAYGVEEAAGPDGPAIQPEVPPAETA